MSSEANKWPIMRLSECCASISDGDHQPPPKADEGVPFVTISNIVSNKLDFTDTMHVPMSYYESLDPKRKAQPGDTLYSVVGSFGIPVFIEDNEPFVFQRHIAILRPSTEVILPKYLYYTMLSPIFYKKADIAAIGAAQRTISLTALRNMEIEVPSLDVQQKVIDYLAPYDDLIATNQKQIALLEEAAQRIYKEWFIDFRFPGYENTGITDGVPDGWAVNKAEAFFDITIGKTPPRAESRWFVTDGGIPWVSISDMGKSGTYVFDTNEQLTVDAVLKHNVKVVQPGTVFVSFKLTVGKVSIATVPMCTNEAIAHFRIPETASRDYAYWYLREFKYDTLGNTSSISQAVNSKIIKAMPFMMPDRKTIEAFASIISPIMSQIKTCQDKCRMAEEARGILLQKQLSEVPNQE